MEREFWNWKARLEPARKRTTYRYINVPIFRNSHPESWRSIAAWETLEAFVALLRGQEQAVVTLHVAIGLHKVSAITQSVCNNAPHTLSASPPHSSSLQDAIYVINKACTCSSLFVRRSRRRYGSNILKGMHTLSASPPHSSSLFKMLSTWSTKPVRALPYLLDVQDKGMAAIFWRGGTRLTHWFWKPSYTSVCWPAVCTPE